MKKVGKRLSAGLGGLLLLGLVAVAFAYRHPLWVLDQQVRFHLWRSGVASAYVDVGGQRIHYLEAKPRGAEGIPLVLIHGLGARGEDWAGVIPGLAAAGYHVYVPDLLGYGRSPRPDASYSIRMQEALINDFETAMHVDRAEVAGWSMGGWLAMKMAVDHPERVDRLMLFDAAGVYFQEPSDLAVAFNAQDPEGVNRLFALMSPHPRPIPGFVAENIVRRIQANLWIVERSLAQMKTGRDLMEFRLWAIRQPTLVVWGRQDALIPLSAGEKIHAGIPGSSFLVVDGCGHLVPAECSRVALHAMVEFMQAEPPMRGGERVVDGRQ